MSETRQHFLRRIRTRVRMSWFVATAQLLAPLFGAVLIALFALQWLTSFDRAVPVALGILGVLLVVLTLAASVVRVSDWDAARAAERGLAVDDVLTTALEFDDDTDPVHHLIQLKADAVVSTSHPATAIPIRAHPKRLLRFAGAMALALLIGFLPPLGSTPALSADIQTALETEARRLEQIAETLEQSDVQGSDDVAAALRDLASEVREAQTLEEALDAISSTQAHLATRVDPDFMAQKAAAQGLAHELALRPLLPELAGDAADQLDDLAAALSQLSPDQQAALASRLRDLAESQAAGNPDLAEALSQAADALEEGDLDAASDALAEAASSQRSSVDSALAQQAISEAGSYLANAEERLSANPGKGSDQGEADGNGQGEGTGEGDDPSSNSGAGNNDTRAINDAAGGGGAPSSGGQSSGTGQGDTLNDAQEGPEAGSGEELPEVYNPIDRGKGSELFQVRIDGGDPEGELVHKGEGVTERGEATIPISEVLPHYLSQAADSLARLRLPPSMRGIVKSYFDSLAAEVR